MFLVELVMQGVRGFREPARLRFKGGFNFIAAGNESGKTTAIDSVQRLLFPNNQPELFNALVSRHAPDASRAALVTCSDEGAYYRMIQDFSKRAVNLSKYNPASKDFSILHKDWNNAVQFMAGMTAGMSEEDYAGIFILRREHYAARQDMMASAAAPRSAPPAFVPPAAGKSSADPKRLAELQETLRKAEEAADAEYKFESAKLAREELAKKITTLEEIEKKKADNQATLVSLKEYEGLPEDLAGLIDEYERLRGKKLADVDEINKQIEGLKMHLAELPTENFTTDKLFIVGAVVGVISILAGVFVLTEKLDFLFPLGVLLSLIMMAAAWYTSSRKNMQRKNILKEEEGLKKELVQLETRFQQEGASVTAFMRSTRATSPAELKEKAGNYRYVLSLRDDIEEQRKRVLGDLTPGSLRQQHEQLEQDVVNLEKAAQALAHNNMDTYGIRQEIERLTSEASTASAEVSWDFGVETPGQPAVSPNVVSGGNGGGFLAELGIACRVAGIEMETLVPAVEAAAQRNLMVVTAGRYVRVEAVHEGGPVVHAKDNSVVDFAELSHGTRSLITFCLRTGLVEALAGKRRIPFILDDPLADFDPARQKTACQILRALGAKTQVILFTSNPALKAEGDAAAELP